MITLLMHGVFDPQTLNTLIENGIKHVSFDLRGRSSNLIPFRDLQSFLKILTTENIYLTFENDKKETILSFLNLLKSESRPFTLIYRDQRPASYYDEIKVPFLWMFHPDSEWKEILSLKHCKGVLLPLKLQNKYQVMPELWSLIDAKDLDVYLHAETFEETIFINRAQDIKLSIDITSEVEKSYRSVDQDKLKQMKIWRRLNENSTGQR